MPAADEQQIGDLRRMLGDLQAEERAHRARLNVIALERAALETRLASLVGVAGLTPCHICGKPADTVSCSMGGCPLGADL